MGSRGQGELEDGAMARALGRPQPATMRLDDGAANRQAHPHATGLGAVERLEDAFQVRGVNARAGILYRKQDAVGVRSGGTDQQLLRAIVDHAHRFRGVQDKVQNDLLQLYTIAHDGGQVASSLRPHNDLASLQFGEGERNHRHVKYGVKLADYDAVREALVWTLEEALGEDFTPAVRDAWTVCYDELAGEMKAAAGL